MALHPLPALTVACLALLAGCGGFVENGPSQTETQTITSAPVPTITSTPGSSVGNVPGLSAQSVADPYDLGRAHRAVLANLSYTRRTNETTRFPNGSLRLRTTRTARSIPTDTGTRFLTTTTYDGPVAPAGVPFPTAARVDVYGDEQVYVRVVDFNGTTTTRSFERLDDRTQTLAFVFVAFETRIAGRTPCGDRTCTRVRSTALAEPAVLADVLMQRDEGMVTDGSLLALVDGRGLVREYRIRYTVETPSRTYTAVRRVRYTALGETTVRQPEWVGEHTN